MKIRLGIDVACRAAHQASCADDTGTFSGLGVVSHESALGVHQIGEFEAARVHLTVPPSFTMTDPALAIHRRTRSTFSADACRFNDGTVTTAPNSPGQRL